MKLGLLLACTLLAVAGCDSEAPDTSTPVDRETVFDPLVETLDRAEGVQQTVDDQAAELRRRIEEQEN